eukprot:scaffold710_cov171-Amphora_coffeaeformis.AAC.19
MFAHDGYIWESSVATSGFWDDRGLALFKEGTPHTRCSNIAATYYAISSTWERLETVARAINISFGSR